MFSYRNSGNIKPIKSNHKDYLIPLVVLIALLVLANISAVLFEYGYNDDYHYLFRAHTGRLLPAYNEIYNDGRPLSSFLVSFISRLVDSVSQLRWIRLASIGCLLFLSFISYHSLVNVVNRWRALGITLMVFSMPPVGALVGWSSIGFNVWVSLFFALSAGYFWSRKKANRILSSLLPSIFLLLICLTIYQPSAALFFIPIIATEWNKTFGKQQILRILYSSSTFLFTAVTYLLVTKLFLVDSSTRMQIGFSWQAILHLLFVEMLYPAMESWAHLFQGSWSILFAGISFSLMATGLFYKLQIRAWKKAVNRLIWGFVLIGANLGPILIAETGYAVYRNQIGLYLFTTFLMALGLFKLKDILTTAYPRIQRLSNAVIALIIMIFYSLSAFYLYEGIVRPNHREYTLVRNELLRNFEDVPSAMVYNPPPHGCPSRFISGPIFEYGVFSSPNEHLVKAFLLNMFREKFILNVRDLGQDRIDGILNSMEKMKLFSQATNHENLPRVDGFELMMGESVEQRVDPFWGEVKVYPDGWLESDWLGRFNNKDFPFVYHDHFKWIWCEKKDPHGNFVINVLNNVYMLFIPETFPDVYYLPEGRRVRIDFEIEKETWYRDLDTGELFFVRENFYQID